MTLKALRKDIPFIYKKEKERKARWENTHMRR